MADGQTSSRNGVEAGLEASLESGQELLPDLPDHITIHHIALKMTWEMRNLMQMVSREWRKAFRSRRVYNARVFSQSTEAYLVLASRKPCQKESVLILYSCKYGTSLQIPPIPVVTSIYPLDYICLDGRIYLWVTHNELVPTDYSEQSSPTWISWKEIWVLDLAGDRQWTMCTRVDHPFRPLLTVFKLGVLDGKIYRFRGNTRPDRVGVFQRRNTDCRRLPTKKRIQDYVEDLPETEVYDLQSNIWSIITRESAPDCATTLRADCEWECEWETEQLRPGPSTIVGRYEPFFSEWRERLSTTLANANECCGRNVMAPQVYYRLLCFEDRPCKVNESLFFVGKQLVKLVMRADDGPPVSVDQADARLNDMLERFVGVDLHAYNSQRDAWEHLRSLPMLPGYDNDGICNCPSLEVWGMNMDPWEGWQASPVLGGRNHDGIWNCAFVNNFIWGIINVCPRNPYDALVALVRSPPFLGEEANGNCAAWTQIACPIDYFHASFSVLRPIYL